MKIPQNDVDRYLRWYVKIPTSERLIIHGDQMSIFRRLLNEKREAGEKAIPSGEVDYQAFCEALSKRYRLHHAKKDNRSDMKATEEAWINLMKNTRKIKKSTVRDKISNDLFMLIKRLREGEDRLSWDEVSKYIAKYHKRKISRGYLYQIFTEMEREAEMERKAVDEPG